MTQEEKQLLLKDLCGRLPYGVVALKTYKEGSKTMESASLIETDDIDMLLGTVEDMEEAHYTIKPYLRPMSSMTEKECITLSKLKPCATDAWKYIKTPVPLYVANIEQFDFFLRHHLDWRGLIPMGLALESPDNMYKTE